MRSTANAIGFYCPPVPSFFPSHIHRRFSISIFHIPLSRLSECPPTTLFPSDHPPVCALPSRPSQGYPLWFPDALLVIGSSCLETSRLASLASLVRHPRHILFSSQYASLYSSFTGSILFFYLPSSPEPRSSTCMKHSLGQAEELESREPKKDMGLRLTN